MGSKNSCNSKSKEHESMWKRKQDYYNKIAEEADSMQGPSHFTDNEAPMSKTVDNQSPVVSKNRRTRRRSDGQQNG